MEKQYKAVFFDLGGTLRIAFLEEAYMRHARRKMAEIAGTDMPYEEFYQMIEERYEPYRKWALGEFKESGDEELWCKWLLPDYDPARIRQVCHELSFQYRQTKGRRVVVDGGVEVIKGLHERGYKLGIISNLIGENEVPDWLEEDGLDSYFDTVILSSVCHMRKPCSEIYDLACQQIGVKPGGVRGPLRTTSSATLPGPRRPVSAAILFSGLRRRSIPWNLRRKTARTMSLKISGRS